MIRPVDHYALYHVVKQNGAYSNSKIAHILCNKGQPTQRARYQGISKRIETKQDAVCIKHCDTARYISVVA